MDIELVKQARNQINDVVKETTIIESDYFTDLSNGSIHLKPECQQRTGSFKIRGALNAIRSMSESQKSSGIVTASAGNHAQGVALASKIENVDATIIMPENAPFTKVKRTREYGATVITHGENYQEAYEYAANEYANRYYLHAYNNQAVISGQGTVGLECAKIEPDFVFVPVGGGGLISGIGTVFNNTDTKVIGVEPSGALSATKALENNEVTTLSKTNTVADGLATSEIGEINLSIIRKTVEKIVTVSDATILKSTVKLLKHDKILAEPSGATALAPFFNNLNSINLTNKKIIAVISGGNIDLSRLSNIVKTVKHNEGTYCIIKTELNDYPGALNGLLNIIAEIGANIHQIEHNRYSDSAVGEYKAQVKISLEVRNNKHKQTLLKKLTENNYPVNFE